MIGKKKDWASEIDEPEKSDPFRGFSESAVTRMKSAAGNFIDLICDDEDPGEVHASAIALTSLAAFLVGLAAARTGRSLEDTVRECQDGFLEHACVSYRGHSGRN
jgi:hypothetical protein